MEVGFNYQEPAKHEPIRIEQVFAEKPGGGIVANPTIDLPPTTPVAFDSEKEQFVALVTYNSTTEKYEAKTTTTGTGENAKTIIDKPEYITGAWVYAGKGDQLVRLINGANLRKETAIITKEQAELIPTINLV